MRISLIMPALLNIQKRTLGWTLAIIIRTNRRSLPIIEIPIAYRPRLASQFKVGSSMRGTILTATSLAT